MYLLCTSQKIPNKHEVLSLRKGLYGVRSAGTNSDAFASYCCHDKRLQHRGLRQYKCTTLQFWKAEFHNGTRWAAIRARAGLCSVWGLQWRTRVLASSSFQGLPAFLARPRGPSSHLQSHRHTHLSLLTSASVQTSSLSGFGSPTSLL